MKIPRLPSIPDKVLFPVIGVILLSGVSVAALKAPTMDEPTPLTKTQIANPGVVVAEPSQSVATETPTETTPAAVSSSEQNANLGESGTPAAPTPLQLFHDTITNQAQALAPLFAQSYFASTQDFVWYQTYCLERGLDDSVGQDVLDAKATFLVPQAGSDGRTAYQFFTGGCRVVQVQR